jgi:hypothetical protein
MIFSGTGDFMGMTSLQKGLAEMFYYKKDETGGGFGSRYGEKFSGQVHRYGVTKCSENLFSQVSLANRFVAGQVFGRIAQHDLARLQNVTAAGHLQRHTGILFHQ